MTVTALLIGFFGALLVLDWRLRLRLVRALAIGTALVTLVFAQPGFHRAARVALSTPSTERVTRFGDRTATGYESGILTLEQALIADAAIGANARYISLFVLVWLAFTPVLRDRTSSSRSQTV